MEIQKVKKALQHCIEGECNNCPNVEELGSGETVCVGRLLPKVLDCIADLEAKLAESEEFCFDLQQRLADKEEQCRECKHLNKKIELNIKNKLLIENEQLKQQLAEKEKEIEMLRENSLARRIFDEKLIPSHCMEQYEKYEQQIDKLNQDKIELLEKVKEICDKPKYEVNYEYYIDCWTTAVDKDSLLNEIDTLISELKGE